MTLPESITTPPSIKHGAPNTKKRWLMSTVTVVRAFRPIPRCAFRPLAALVGAALLVGVPAACQNKPSPAPAGSASASAAARPPPSASAEAIAKIAHGVPLPEAQVEKVVNPKREAAYSGPTGTVAGSVSLAGDESPADPSRVKDIPADCLAARDTYKDLFREGMLRAAADVFVAVTGYKGYVPADQDQLTVEAKGCAFSTRTVGLTFGQGLDIVSKDRRAYVPELLGGRATAQLVVTPGGKPVRLYPQRPGRYILVDSMRTFAAADVLVVAYSTFDVTGLDGKFEIKNVPVGKVKLNALLPEAMLTTERDIVVEAGKTTTADLELKFDQKIYAEAVKKKPPRRATASTEPAKPKPSP